MYSISLHYRDDRSLFDQYGNWFHYQAALNPNPRDGESKDGRVTYDVFSREEGRPGRKLSSARSRGSRRRNEWETLLTGESYRDGMPSERPMSSLQVPGEVNPRATYN